VVLDLRFVSFCSLYWVYGDWGVLRETDPVWLSDWGIRVLSAIVGLAGAGAMYYPTKFFVEYFRKEEYK